MRFFFLFVSLLCCTSCSGDRAVLSANFLFFIPFGDARGEAGTPAIANDRAPLAEGFTASDNYLVLLEPDNPHLLIYTTEGKLVFDRKFASIAPKGNEQSHYLAAVSPSGSAWLAAFESVKDARGYRLYQVHDDESELASAAFLRAVVYEQRFANRRESYTPLLQSMRLIDNQTILFVWHALAHRAYTSGRSEESATVTAVSIYNINEKTHTMHRLDLERFRQTESGDLRFDTILSVHPLYDHSKFLIEVQYRKADIRNPYEKALFVLDMDSDSLEPVSLSRPTWNSLLGVSRDGTLYFIDDVEIFRDSTRAIIGLYNMETFKDMRYAIEADPTRPTMSNFVFSSRGTFYSLEVFERGINFYSWK
ncbi:MAG: hypothetical protein LBC99_01820 [Spirochaetota bacterium]|nr:hypothetical protein [Spirochaetota bacterium]